MVTQLIGETRENKGDLFILWLNLTNACGAIPHKLVVFVLHHHRVSNIIQDLILHDYNNIRLRVTSG